MSEPEQPRRHATQSSQSKAAAKARTALIQQKLEDLLTDVFTRLGEIAEETDK